MPNTNTFTSRHRNLRITRRPHVELATATGAYRTVEQPVRYQFHDRGGAGVLEVTPGQDLLPDGAPVLDDDGYAVRDAHGHPKFEMQDAVAFLRSLPEYNQAEIVGGFREVGREPDRIPEAAPAIREIMQAFAQLDLDTLLRLAAEEQQASYDRPAVTAALEEAIPQVQAARDALQAAQDAPQGDGQPQGGEPAGTPENGGGDALEESFPAVSENESDDLDGIDKMADLKAIVGAEVLGVTFPPGTSKVKARELIREARAARETAAA